MSEFPLTFVVPVSDRDLFEANMARSPDLEKCSLIIGEGWTNPAAFFNSVRGKIDDNHYVCFVHQDVYLPIYWILHLFEGIEKVEKQDLDWGVIGVIGATLKDGVKDVVGHARDRGTMIRSSGLPAKVESIDDILMVCGPNVRNRLDGPWFDENMPSYHLFGLPLCLVAQEKGLSCWVVDACCEHNNPGKKAEDYEFGSDFYMNCGYLYGKWRHRLPLIDASVTITKAGDAKGTVCQLWR